MEREIWRTTVAIKRLLVNVSHLEKIKERFCREVFMWKRLSDPNTIPLLGAYIRGSELVMISEWMDNGNVMQYLRKNSRANKPSLLADVARGIIYLHSMNVVHGDLKGLNILVKHDGTACLADFGLMSIVLDPETTDITTSTGGGAKGTYRWMSPELFYPTDFGISKFQLTKESDCYAFGIVIYEVLSGSIPFEKIKMPWQIPIAVQKGTRPGIPEGIPPGIMGLWDIAKKCWSQNPWDRPSFRTVLDDLDAFARVEDVTPFALREPRPMKVKGQPTETTTEWQALLTGELSEAAPPADSSSQSQPTTPTISPVSKYSQLPPPARVNDDGFGTGATGGKLKRVLRAVQAATRFSKFRFR